MVTYKTCWPPGSLSSYSQVCFETIFSSLLSLCFGFSQKPLGSFSFLSSLQYKWSDHFSDFFTVLSWANIRYKLCYFLASFLATQDFWLLLASFLYGVLALKPHTGHVLKKQRREESKQKIDRDRKQERRGEGKKEERRKEPRRKEVL